MTSCPTITLPHWRSLGRFARQKDSESNGEKVDLLTKICKKFSLYHLTFRKGKPVPPRSLHDTSLPDLEEAVAAVLTGLYNTGVHRPVTFKTLPKIDRNSEIVTLYQNGLSIPKLARRYGISNARVHQILRNTRRGHVS